MSNKPQSGASAGARGSFGGKVRALLLASAALILVSETFYEAKAYAGDNEANRALGITQFNKFDDAGNLVERGQLLFTERTHNRVVTVGLNILLDSTFKTGVTTPTWFVGIVGPAITDGAITATAAVLTSASNPWTPGDAGRAIIVRGAGAAGADLVTTIQTYNSAGNVTLASNAGTTVAATAAVLWDARAADTMASHAPWTESAAYSQSTRPAFTPGSISGGSVDNSASQATFTINVNNTLIGGLFLVNNSTISGTSGTLYGMAPFSVSFRQLNSGDSLAVTATLTQTSV